jgi:hypothetical protein
MMVYKFWDSITKEDLEFAVGIKSKAMGLWVGNTWEIRDPMLSDSAMALMVNNASETPNYGSIRS